MAIEPGTAADLLEFYARACGLTPRESEVLALLCEGLDTREIVERMVVSEHTACDHLIVPHRSRHREACRFSGMDRRPEAAAFRILFGGVVMVRDDLERALRLLDAGRAARRHHPPALVRH